MIFAAPGTSFEATSRTDSGLAGTLGVRIMDGQGTTTVARTTSGIVETPAGSGVYTVTLTAPATVGTYTVVWDTGADPDLYAVEELQVRAVGRKVVFPGTEVEVTVSNADTGLEGTIGVRVMDGVGGTAVARSTDNIVETPAGSGIYTATLTVPTTAGVYTAVWDTGGGTPTFAVEDFEVTNLALTSLAAVRSYLQKNDSTNRTQDEIIQELILRASAQINRTIAFFPLETGATKTFVWRGGPLSLHPYFLGSADSITLDSDTDYTTTLSVSDYRLRPKPTPTGLYRWVTMPNTSLRAGVEREVTIVGDWGFSTIPDDVEHWTIVTVATWLRRDVSAFSTTLRLDEDRLERPDALPSAAVRALARYATPAGF